MELVGNEDEDMGKSKSNLRGTSLQRCELHIPIIYLANTGEWINVCGLTYDNEGKILKVDAWDGDGVVTYEEGEFILNEDNVALLYQIPCSTTNRD